jgi:hypothetical protein
LNGSERKITKLERMIGAKEEVFSLSTYHSLNISIFLMSSHFTVKREKIFLVGQSILDFSLQ